MHASIRPLFCSSVTELTCAIDRRRRRESTRSQTHARERQRLNASFVPFVLLLLRLFLLLSTPTSSSSHSSSQNKTTADTANAPQLKKLYHNSSLALAGLVPLAVFQQQGDLFGRIVDAGLTVALPIHSHIAMNYVVTDYIPKSVRGAARWGVLGSSVVIAAGMLKLNVAGPGVTATVKALWKGGEAGFAAAAGKAAVEAAEAKKEKK